MGLLVNSSLTPARLSTQEMEDGSTIRCDDVAGEGGARLGELCFSLQSCTCSFASSSDIYIVAMELPCQNGICSRHLLLFFYSQNCSQNFTRL